jgi:hypothetical protein
MSSCTYLPKLKAEDNIKDHLTNLGAINPVTMEIYAPIDTFEKTLEKMTDDSNNSYFTNLKFFSVKRLEVKKAGVERNTTSRTDTTRTMYQLVTNSESFEQIDQIRNALGIYESQEAIGSYRKRKKLEIAREQAELQQRLDAARAGVGYTDEYLFSKDLAKIEFQDPTGQIKLTHDLKNTFRDPNIKDRFFPDSNDQTIKSVLDRIIKEGGSYADLAKHLKDLVVFDIPVQLIELDFLIGMKDGKSFNAGGQYQPDYNNGRKKERIVLPEGAGHLNNDSAHTIMHEIIHALSWRTLENKHKYVVTEEVNAFKEAYNHAKTFFENNPQYKSKSEHFAYRLSDVHEFLTGMLTDPDFIRDLKNVPVSDSVNDIAKDWKSFFDEIIEKLLAMLGITPEKNFYNQASTVASHVLQMQNYVEDINPMTEDEKDMYKRFEDERNIPLDFFNDEYGEAPFNKSQTSVKEGVSNLFKNNTQLSTIGTPEQYSQYLDTIFPDSKVKDIVYHGTRGYDSSGREKPKFDKFDKSFIGKGQGLRSDDMAKGFYFGSYKIADRVGTRIIPAILNIEEENTTTARRNTVDFDTKGDVFVVFEPEQVHILGSEKDLENFKKFVNERPASNVQELFESNPELASIGTVEQYSQYLDTIFPKSTVKDIVYHGTDTKKDKFLSLNAGTHFGTKKAATERRNKVLLPVLLNINNSVLFKDVLDDDVLKAADKFLKENGEYLEYGYRNEESGLLVYLYNQGKLDSNTLWDALYSDRNTMMQILQNALGSNGYRYINQVEDKGSTSYVVFEPEQIHILGSKQDIKGFEKFVNKPIVSDNQYNVQLNLQNLESTIEDVVTKKLQEKIFRIGKVLFEKIELDNVNIHVKKNSETEFSIAIDNKGTSIFGTLSAVLDFQKRDLDSNEIYSPNPKGFILWETFLKSEVASMPKAKVIVDNRFDIALGTLKALKNNGIESIHFPQSFSEDFKKEYSQFLKQDFSSVGFANDADSFAKTIKISIDDLVSVITAVNSQLKISQHSANSVQLNLQNLELTNEVIDYLYNVSSQRLSRESYGKEAYKLVTNLKGSLTKEEVVEKLKCL